MTKPKKITVPMVKKAYKTTGIKPVYGTYCDDQYDSNDEWYKKPIKCGCPLTALYLERNPEVLDAYMSDAVTYKGKMFDTLVDTWSDMEFGAEYASDFVNAIDNKHITNASNKRQGLRDGIDVRKAIFGKGKKK